MSIIQWQQKIINVKKIVFYDGRGWQEEQIRMLPKVSYLLNIGINGHKSHDQYSREGRLRWTALVQGSFISALITMCTEM